jgi:hypothetical protein
MDECLRPNPLLPPELFWMSPDLYRAQCCLKRGTDGRGNYFFTVRVCIASWIRGTNSTTVT